MLQVGFGLLLRRHVKGVLRLGTSVCKVVMGTVEFELQNQGVWLSGHVMVRLGWMGLGVCKRSVTL